VNLVSKSLRRVSSWSDRAQFRRAELVLQGLFDVFTIHFQPSGFHQFFRAPMPDLADQAYDATSVIGAVATEIAERLAEASCFHERIQVATNFLLRYLQEGHPGLGRSATGSRTDDHSARALDVRAQLDRRPVPPRGSNPWSYLIIVIDLSGCDQGVVPCPSLHM
jgi:hypothetical protein